MENLTFDKVAEKYSKAKKDETAMAKMKLTKHAELTQKKGELNMQAINEREALEQALITPNKDALAAYEQITLTEARVEVIDKFLAQLFPEG